MRAPRKSRTKLPYCRGMLSQRGLRFCLVIWIFLVASLVRASDLSGHVVLADGRDAANAIVYLEGAERSRPERKAMVDQRDRTFIPHVSVITVGTRVAFPNNDSTFHNVFADYDARKFNLGLYPRGATKYMNFPKPGLVVLMCSIHPDMLAYIMVVDTPYHAVTDSHGRFGFHDLPAGDYKIKIWHESRQTAAMNVHLTGNASENVQLRR